MYSIFDKPKGISSSLSLSLVPVLIDLVRHDAILSPFCRGKREGEVNGNQLLLLSCDLRFGSTGAHAILRVISAGIEAEGRSRKTYAAECRVLS